MPQSATGQSTTGQVPSGAPAVSVQYRYRVGARVSPWMTAEQLKDAAAHGELTPEGEVQQSGHTEWVLATHVRGLAFPQHAPEPAAAAPPVVETMVHAATLRHPRFSTFRDLLVLYANADIEVNLPDASEFSPAKLCAAGTDHFEIVLETGRSRVFLPYSRIDAIWATETSTSATMTYRESHRITVELRHAKH